MARKKESSMTKLPPPNHRPIIVGTEDKGLFFGYVPESLPNRKICREIVDLTSARMVVYFPRSVGGALGLAADGPVSGCRIGPRADIAVGPVRGVASVSEAAVAVWEDFEWTP